MVDLKYELDRLYQVPLADFIGARNDLAKRLRVEGDRDRAEEVKKLAKPSLTAWAVNQLHFCARPRLDALLAVGDQLRTAIGEGAEAHREVMKARREAIAELSAIAAEILDAAGQTLNRAHRQRLSRNLEALASGAAGAVPGRLSRDLEPAGFEAVSDLAASLARMPRQPPKLELVSADRPPGELAEVVDLAAERQSRAQKNRDRKLEQARRAVVTAGDRLAALERRADQADSELAAAERREAETKAAVEDAEQCLRQAREELEAAAARTTAARLDAEAAAASRKRAGDELAAAERKLRLLRES